MFLQDGTTVAAILVLDDTVYSGNLGDSKAVLCRKSASETGKLSFVHLTKDHNPSNVSNINFTTYCWWLTANYPIIYLCSLKREKE